MEDGYIDQKKKAWLFEICISDSWAALPDLTNVLWLASTLDTEHVCNFLRMPAYFLQKLTARVLCIPRNELGYHV
jgi:hypothetical protein